MSVIANEGVAENCWPIFNLANNGSVHQYLYASSWLSNLMENGSRCIPVEYMNLHERR